ncbi:MAG: DNA-processing protein DprA [candidate division Zixibacteria bacterium]|nr:DNA-processing protein DprA [candidate division Zixibacteria bacterium]
MTDSSKDLQYWLALATVPNVGIKRFLSLVRHFGSPETVLNASIRDLERVDDVGQITSRSIKGRVDWKEAENQIKSFEKSQCRWTSFDQPDYPAGLLQISDPPPFIFYRGQFSESDNRAIAIVGSRSATNYGKMITEKITAGLVSREITIISGMAAGIDSYAHRAALDQGGRTMAVVGTGLDIIYPSQNRDLCQNIESHGAVISEFFFGTKPEPENFPRRNRIISGLSLGVVIVEASAKSGALLTAQLALDQGREVFAVPGNLGNKTSEGTNNLIKQGAKLVTTPEDILEELRLEPASSQIKKVQVFHQLTAHEEKIFDILSAEPIHVDLLSQKVDLTTPQTLSSLLNLELKGLARQLSGKLFVRV